MSDQNRRLLSSTAMRTLAATSLVLGGAVALSGCNTAAGLSKDTKAAVNAVAPCSPCSPCIAANPCNPCVAVNPCNPCAVANPCNPCAAVIPTNPCALVNPCAAK